MPKLPWHFPHRPHQSAGSGEKVAAPAGQADAVAPDTPQSDIATRFRAAWVGPSDPDTAIPELLPVRLARACMAVLPVAGAGLSLMDDSFRVPLGCNDDTATHAERLQFTQGEGPCLDSARKQRTFVATSADIAATWPAFWEELVRQTPYRAVISMPLDLAPDVNGALDLFLRDDDQLRQVAIADASVVTTAIEDALRIAHAITAPHSPWTDEPEPLWLQGSTSQRRADVRIAMGMTMIRFSVTAEDALALLRAYAYGHDTTLDDTAEALLDGRLDVDQIS